MNSARSNRQNERKIGYTIFPVQNLNSQVSVHTKRTNPHIYNFQTLAYEKLSCGKQPQTQCQRNFIKNYYLQNVPSSRCLTNNIILQLAQQTYPFNAYNLAENATKDYKEFQYKRRQYLINAKKRAQLHSNQWGKNNKYQLAQSLEQNTKWVKKIIIAINQLSDNMFGNSNPNKQNQSANTGKQRMFLNQKAYVNSQYLKNYKITDPTTSKAILEDLRAGMLKTKKKLDGIRLQNMSNSKQNSCLSETSISNTTSQSINSVISQVNSKDRQVDMISNLCNFQELKIKWKSLDVSKIKDMVLYVLAKNIILDGEIQKTKKIRLYQKQSKSIPSKINHNKNPTQALKRAKTHQKRNQKRKIFLNKSQLSKQQIQIKDNMIKTSGSDTFGSKYQKIKNYSHLFAKDKDKIKLTLNTTINQNLYKGSQIKFNLNKQNHLQGNQQNHRQGNQNNNQPNKNICNKSVIYQKMQKGYKTTRTSYLRN